MPLIFEESSVIAPFVLSCVYFVVTIIGTRKLYLLQKVVAPLNTRKLFVMNCLLSSFLRFLSFSSMTIFIWCEFHVDVDSSGTTTEGDDDQYNPERIAFFDKASLVLFDFPDFCFISAYVLLLVVWAEAILQSRRHWWSSANFRKTWMMGYVVFNSLLYIIQVALYSLLFLPAVDQGILTDLIYLTLTGVNLLLPMIWLCVYLYLVIMMSGFPYTSAEASDRLSALGWLGIFWTFTRIGWGVVALTSVVKDWITSTVTSYVTYSIFLVSVFVVVEVLPILYGFRTKALSTTVEKNMYPEKGDETASPILQGSHSRSKWDEEEEESPWRYTSHQERGSSFSESDVMTTPSPPPDTSPASSAYTLPSQGPANTVKGRGSERASVGGR